MWHLQSCTRGCGCTSVSGVSVTGRRHPGCTSAGMSLACWQLAWFRTWLVSDDCVVVQAPKKVVHLIAADTAGAAAFAFWQRLASGQRSCCTMSGLMMQQLWWHQRVQGVVVDAHVTECACGGSSSGCRIGVEVQGWMLACMLSCGSQMNVCGWMLD